METVRILNATKRSVLGTRIAVAATRWTRLRGYLARPAPAPGEGLMLVPCRGVHMYGMGFALDVLLVDPNGEVVSAYPELGPGKRTSLHRRAHLAIELPVGTIEATRTETGDKVVWLPVHADGGDVAGDGASDPREAALDGSAPGSNES